MSIIVPAIIPQSRNDLQDTLEIVRPFAKEIQVDVVDGIFVPFMSWPYGTEEKISDLAQWSKEFSIEMDLMVMNPEEVIEEYVKAGAKRIVVHIESTRHLNDIIKRYTKRDFMLGLSINNDTELAPLMENLEKIDYVQCMGIAEIGSQGQPFDERVLERIHLIHEVAPDMEIAVDGSVNHETLSALHKVGVTRFAAGSAILKAQNPEEAFRELESMIAS